MLIPGADVPGWRRGEGLLMGCPLCAALPWPVSQTLAVPTSAGLVARRGQAVPGRSPGPVQRVQGGDG